MTDEATNKPSEGDAGAIDMTKFVSKEDYDKTVGGKESELTSLQKSLEEAQGHLTSPQYLKYLAAEKAKAATPSTDSSKSDVTLPKEVTDRIANLEATANQLAAVLELQEVERKYTDFKDYRNDVHTLISSGGNNLNFEQAYLIAKSQKSDAKPSVDAAKAATDKPAAGTEKPGQFIPDPSSTTKEFKNTDEATQDAVNTIKEKYGITGDTI